MAEYLAYLAAAAIARWDVAQAIPMRQVVSGSGSAAVLLVAKLL